MVPPSTNPTPQKPFLLWRRPRPWDPVSLALLYPRHQDSCTLRISQLQESGFWHKCLSMKPSFAKQIRVFSRIVLTCSITFENVLICNMSPVWLLQSPSGPFHALYSEIRGPPPKPNGVLLSVKRRHPLLFSQIPKMWDE